MNRTPFPSRRTWAALAASCTAALVVIACGGGTPAADLVLKNGYVYTQDDTLGVQQAVAVRDGVIVFVGSDRAASDLVDAHTRVVDLGGRMLMPGFVDAHLHPLAGGRALLLCDLKYASLTRAQMAAEIQSCLDDSADKGPDVWLEVANWSRQGTQAVDADPDKRLLDALSTTRPILVRSSDFHTVLTNSRGLALAGVDRTTPDPVGGVFVRDRLGEPTGICEDAAGFQVAAVIPPDTDADRLAQGRAALAAMRAQGVTSFMDAAAGPDQGRTFTALQQAGELTARAFLAYNLDPEATAANPSQAVADALAQARRFDQGEAGPAPTVRMRHLKLFADGVVNAPADTGALLQPYFTNAGTDAAPNWVPGSNRGNLYQTPEVMQAVAQAAAKQGLDLHVHATGDRAVRTALDAFASVRQALPGSDFRPAIAHNETVDPADYPRFAALDVTATFSFQWAQRAPYSVGDTEQHLGPERFARMEPSGSLAAAGARVAFGSDWPIDPFDEFLALKIGVTRAGDPLSPNGFGPAFAGRINDDPALSRAQVLRAITLNAAHQLRLERQVGSIRRGKWADLIVLARNFMEVPEEELARNQVLLTLVGGQIVHASGDLAGLGTSAAGRQSAARLGIRNAAAYNGHSATGGGVHGDGHRH